MIRALRPLHGGRHSIPADVLAHNQRERLLAALASCAAEHGYNATTISQITSAASVSRRTFYEHFAGKEECFLAAYEALDGYLGTVMEEAVERESEWPDQVAAAFVDLLDFLASRPNFARLYLVEAAVVGEGMADAREKTAKRFIALLEPGRRYRDVDPGIEEGLVGGIVTLLGRRVLGGEADRPGSLRAGPARVRPRPLPGGRRGAPGDRAPRAPAADLARAVPGGGGGAPAARAAKSAPPRAAFSSIRSWSRLRSFWSSQRSTAPSTKKSQPWIADSSCGVGSVLTGECSQLPRDPISVFIWIWCPASSTAPISGSPLPPLKIAA